MTQTSYNQSMNKQHTSLRIWEYKSLHSKIQILKNMIEIVLISLFIFNPICQRKNEKKLLPPSQYSMITTTWGPSNEIPYIWTTFGCWGNSLHHIYHTTNRTDKKNYDHIKNNRISHDSFSIDNILNTNDW
jgi:hypothetical protein